MYYNVARFYQKPGVGISTTMKRLGPRRRSMVGARVAGLGGPLRCEASPKALALGAQLPLHNEGVTPCLISSNAFVRKCLPPQRTFISIPAPLALCRPASYKRCRNISRPNGAMAVWVQHHSRT